ncbi:MAG TPA: hypothetical protein VGL05_15625 [Kribbella sp.]
MVILVLLADALVVSTVLVGAWRERTIGQAVSRAMDAADEAERQHRLKVLQLITRSSPTRPLVVQLQVPGRRRSSGRSAPAEGPE